MGFTVERGKKRLRQRSRALSFSATRARICGHTRLTPSSQTSGIALEVEAGRATMGNAIYRDLIQGSLIVDARFLALAVPLEYRYQSGARIAHEPSYTKTYSVVEAIYGSPRLALPFEGLLLIGY